MPEDHVAGLQIAMSNSAFMRGFKRAGDLLRDDHCLLERHRGLFDGNFAVQTGVVGAVDCAHAFKVLDFGLAKMATPAEAVSSAGSDPSQSPTMRMEAATKLLPVLFL